MDLKAVVAHIEIRQALANYCRGVDRRDVALLKSVYHPDATDDHGVFRGNGHDFADWLVGDNSQQKIVGQHHITNVYVDLHGDHAHVESYYIAFNPVDRADGTEIIMPTGGRYIDRFEYRDGAWRIARRVCTVEWSRKEMLGEAWLGQKHFAPVGARGNDVSDVYFGPDRDRWQGDLDARLETSLTAYTFD